MPKNDNLGLATESAPPVVARSSLRRMETITCTVRNNGDLRNEVILHRVTPPEVLILRRIHGGAEAVVACVVDGACQFAPAGEKQRLSMKYPRYKALIEQMFGGISPDFMTTLAEVEELAAVELGRQEQAIEDGPLTLEPQPLD